MKHNSEPPSSAGSQEAESGKIDPQITSTQSRPRDIMDVIADMCEQDGAICDVGPDYYRAFADLCDSDLAEMIFDLMRHQRNYIEGKEGEVIANAAEFATALLRFVAWGYIAFDEYGRVAFHKPIGPEPSDGMWDELEQRIERAQPLMRAIAHRLFRRK